MATFADHFFDLTADYSDLVALVDPERNISLTFGEIQAKTLGFAKMLKKIGLKKGDRVGTFVGNSADFLIFCLTANQLGAVLCPLNPAYKKVELEHYFGEAKVRWVLTEAEHVEKLQAAPVVAEGRNLILLPTSQDLNHNDEELKVVYSNVPARAKTSNSQNAANLDETTEDDGAVIFFSSGTTGLPKGVLLSHRSLIAHLTIVKEIQESSDPDFVVLNNNDTVYGVLPYFHAGGFLTVFVMLVQGAKVLVNRKFDEELFLKNIEKYQVTVLNVVPPILELLTHSPMADPKKSLASLRIIYVGAAAVRKDMENAVRHKFAEVELIQLYGSTESGILVFMVPRKEKFEELLAVKPGTCGIALPGVKTKIFPPNSDDTVPNPHFGELLLKTSTQMSGYLNHPEDAVFDEDGYFHTGDLVHVDPDGFYYIIGRLKELIKVRGWQVSPYELEEALRKKFPAILDVAIIGLPDDTDGEQPAAVVILKPNVMLSGGEIENFVTENFVSYKRLTAGVYFVDDFPHLPSGKLDRLALKRMLLDEVL